MAEVVTTMHIFDLTRISRCRCPGHGPEHNQSVFVRVSISSLGSKHLCQLAALLAEQ